ncbi:uncharacterized protein LOC116173078 [Photinus pyralis]|uniref:uncharacterized protein LOC116173078 n=1 Tax=Photinus pyralis TaxID=7054 RepID=UPI001266FC08|nr:uncharacterized protein LOC116173078 [Photinus pyralis]
MKTVLVLVLCVFAWSCCEKPGPEGPPPTEHPKHHGRHHKLEKECQEKGNLTDADMKTIRKVWHTGQAPTEPSDAIKCYFKCVLVHEKKLTEDGAASLKGMQQNYTKAVEKLGECNQIKNNDRPCDAALSLATCLSEVKHLVRGF